VSRRTRNIVKEEKGEILLAIQATVKLGEIVPVCTEALQDVQRSRTLTGSDSEDNTEFQVHKIRRKFRDMAID
jgi:hypothetical protein